MSEHSAASDPDLDESLVDDLRAVFLRPPSVEVEAAHLDALFAAARPASELDRRHNRRALAASAGVGVGIAITLSAGLAAASGSLPPRLQELAHDVVAPLGIDVPAGYPPATPSSADDERDAGPSTTGESIEAGDDGAETPPEPVGAEPGAAVGPSNESPEASPSNGVGASSDVPSAAATDREGPTPSSTVPDAPGRSGGEDRRPTSPPGRPDDPGRSSTAPGQAEDEDGDQP